MSSAPQGIGLTESKTGPSLALLNSERRRHENQDEREGWHESGPLNRKHKAAGKGDSEKQPEWKT